MEFSDCLNRIMKEKGINQAQLCKLSGIATSAMSHYVRGETEPSFTKVIAIARALDVPVDMLAGERHASNSCRDISPAERELIGIYRSLNAHGRDQLMVFARGCAASYPLNTADSMGA